MAKYYNQNHVQKQFRQGQLIKLLTKNLKLEYLKFSGENRRSSILDSIAGEVFTSS
jgi:hypothetical protein